MLTTNTLLLEGLRDQGNDALWGLFCRRYRPVIMAVGRRLGLSDHKTGAVALVVQTLQKTCAGDDWGLHLFLALQSG